MASATGEFVNKIQEYIEVKTEQVKLLVMGKVAKGLSGVLVLSLAVLLSFFLLFFLSFGLANVFNEWLDSSYLGYFILCGFYLLLICIVVILARRKIIQGWLEAVFMNAIEKEDEEED